jgi:hypothetical protein
MNSLSASVMGVAKKAWWEGALLELMRAKAATEPAMATVAKTW